MNDNNIFEEELNRIVEETYAGLTRGKKPSDNPRCYISGGQPGAGTEGLRTIFKMKCDNLILLYSDRFQKLHPYFKGLQSKYGKDIADNADQFVEQVTVRLAAKLRAEKYNVLIEDTLRTAEIPLKTCKEFKESGYEVTLGVVALKAEISYLSTLLRYEQQLAEGKTPRATAKDKHDYVVEHLPDNLRKIYDSKQFDSIVIYDRDGVCLYDTSKNNTTTPDKVMEDVFSSDWSDTEIEQFKKTGEETKAFKVKRNAADLRKFIENIFNRNIVEEFITGIPTAMQTVFYAPRSVTDKYKAFVDPKLETAYQKIKHEVIELLL